MSENQYQPGQRIHTEGRFKAAGVFQDPTTVTVKLKDPGGGVTQKVYGTDPEVVRDAKGRFHMELTTGGTPGRWVYRYVGAGAIEASAEQAFIVARTAIP